MERKMEIRPTLNEKGITLIELLVTLVIAAITLAGAYRVFISQTRTYAIQDQVVEVQQNVRSAMEIILRDLRMTGFDDDHPSSTVTVATPIVTPVQTNSITVSYEYCNRTTWPPTYELHQVAYAVNGNSELTRTLLVTAAVPPVPNPRTEPLLDNVSALNFTYGIDANNDKIMDDQNGDGIINAADYVAAASVGTAKVVAVRVTLTGGPNPINQDVAKVVSPRTLVSAVTLRNICLR
jgi:prepilin-type N-terminal cleavage/methylation domain-containing protein